jgi:hypothetical protein
MNLGLIPLIMSVAIAIVCGLAAALGGLLLIGRESRPLGWQIIRCAGLSLVTGLFFAWAGLFFLSGAVLLLWASGPVGVLFGVLWHCLRLPIASRPP